MGSGGQLLYYSSAALTSCCSIMSSILKVLVKIIFLYTHQICQVSSVFGMLRVDLLQQQCFFFSFFPKETTSNYHVTHLAGVSHGNIMCNIMDVIVCRIIHVCCFFCLFSILA